MPTATENLPRRPLAWLLAAALALAALAGAGAERAAAAPLPPLRTGVSYVYGNDPLEFQHVLSTGSKLALTPLRWWEVAPRQQPAGWDPENPADPHYDWEFADLWVRHAVEAGVIPVLQVRGAPNWAQNCPTPYPHDSPCKPDPKALAAFAKAAARRYSGSFGGLPRVYYWQGLNEPNLSLFFNPQYEGSKAVSPILYRKLINSFYGAIKSVDPTNLVLAAGLGPLEVKGYTIGPMNFARKLLCMTGRENPKPTPGKCEGGVHFDIFDIHPYTTGGPTHQGGIDDVEMGDLGKLQTLLKAADEAGRIKGKFKRTPLWITEMSWDSNPPDPTGLAMNIAMQWVPETLYRAWKAGVSNFLWFSLVDFEPNPPGGGDVLQSGLYFWAPKLAEQQPKEIVKAYRFPFVAYPKKGKGLLVWGRTPTSSGGKVAIEVEKGGAWRPISVLRADRNGIFTRLLKSGYGSDRRGAVRATYFGETSPGFPMNPVGDFYQPPFGTA